MVPKNACPGLDPGLQTFRTSSCSRIKRQTLFRRFEFRRAPRVSSRSNTEGVFPVFGRVGGKLARVIIVARAEIELKARNLAAIAGRHRDFGCRLGRQRYAANSLGEKSRLRSAGVRKSPAARAES